MYPMSTTTVYYCTTTHLSCNYTLMSFHTCFSDYPILHLGGISQAVKISLDLWYNLIWRSGVEKPEEVLVQQSIARWSLKTDLSIPRQSRHVDNKWAALIARSCMWTTTKSRTTDEPVHPRFKSSWSTALAFFWHINTLCRSHGLIKEVSQQVSVRMKIYKTQFSISSGTVHAS